MHRVMTGQDKPKSLITYANHGGREQAAFYVCDDGKHRITVMRVGTREMVSISRCQIILNPDNR